VSEPEPQLPSDLPAEKQAVVSAIVRRLAEVPGVAAIVLGGSYARGVARPDSDVDLGVYYLEREPLDVEKIRPIAEECATGRPPTVTALYEWGPWVNGGAWIPTAAGKVDLLYRNIDQVRRVIDDARAGRLEWHFGQQPPYGFYNVIYLAETQACVPLHDPSRVVAALKAEVASYPPGLRNAIVREFLWSAEFSLSQGRSFAAAGDVYDAVGCVTRIVCALTQVLFALNDVYFMTDKGALETIDGFRFRPLAYGGRVRTILAHPGGASAELVATMQCLSGLVADVVALAGDLYTPKYSL
jgi:nucleotidyltransferase-like protein